MAITPVKVISVPSGEVLLNGTLPMEILGEMTPVAGMAAENSEVFPAASVAVALTNAEEASAPDSS